MVELYDGRPCYRCGGVERKRSTRQCYPCSLADNRRYMAERRKRDPEKERRQLREWRKRNKEHSRHYRWRWELENVFGITVEEYDDMLEDQGGVCAICQEPEKHKRNGRVIRLAVDHDEETGAVRALLCSWCNTAIGGLRHSPGLCRAAAQYLEEHNDD